MKTNLRTTPLIVLALALAAGASAAQAALTHRFSFTEPAKDGVTRDLVGTVEGKLMGSGATIADGKLVLKNDGVTDRDQFSYLAFSASLLPKGGTSTSLVVWFSAKDLGGFARVINFGNSEAGEGKEFIYFSPHTGDGSTRVAITATDASGKTFLDSEASDDGKPHMVAIVIDGAEKKLHVFVDGKEPNPAIELGDNTLDKVKSVESWLGKSSFANDAAFSGQIDELRVYDTALAAGDVVAAFKAGPDTLPTGPAVPAAEAAKPAATVGKPAAAPAASAAPAPAPASAQPVK